MDGVSVCHRADGAASLVFGVACGTAQPSDGDVGLNGKIKLAVVATHPIQYHIPWYRGLAGSGEVDLKVYYAMLPDAQQQGVGFGVAFNWDIPMLDGYCWELLPNAAKKSEIGTFVACDVANIADYFRRDRPHAILLTGWHSKVLLQALWAGRRLRIPCIVRGESNVLRPRAIWKKLLHRLLLRGYDRFLAIGKSNREFYLQANIQRQRIHDCGYFIDNKRFCGAAEQLRRDRGALRDKMAIPPGSVCFLYAGKLEPKKRLPDLLDALGKAKSKGAACHLLVVGDGQLMTAAKRMSETKDLPVSFAGFLNQAQIVEAYVAADCLVLPSDYGETWGLVVNEAMACGLPAIVSDQVGCAPDLVEDGVTGGVYPMGDVDALAEKLVEFAADRNKLRLMGRTARLHVTESYSVECAVRATLDAVRAVVAKRR